MIIENVWAFSIISFQKIFIFRRRRSIGMSKIIDLTGQRFGRLIVLEKDESRKTNSGSYWICQCDCGKQKSIRSSSLRRGEIVSCGCFRMEKIMETKEKRGLIDNLIGQKFGFLTVLSKDSQRTSSGQVKWICQCDCGNIISVRGEALKNKTENRTISCGCAHISFGELKVKEILDNNNIIYAQQQGFIDLPRKHFDFSILNENNQVIRLIEFDGEQHYKEVPLFKEGLQRIQERDEEKNQWAREHNIPLVRIPYWERDSITLDMILGDKYLVK